MYKLTDEIALVQTVDFFTPIVDDPFLFGQIAAANALSDVYAMGARPLCAMNLVCFPKKLIDISILQEVLRGGLSKMDEAGVALAGGHSIEDKELKYGLSVTGVIHPDAVLTNRGARPGDKLILTKPLGTGIVATAIKGQAADAGVAAKVAATMAELNREAADAIREVYVNACTDVTGFGLIGHACEMIEDADVGIVIDTSAVPCFDGTREFCQAGFLSGGLRRNRSYREGMVEIEPTVADQMVDILYDPQTSGGLLVSCMSDEAERLIDRLHGRGVEQARIIGEVREEPKGKIVLR